MEERPDERAITVGIDWVLLPSATSGFSGYIKLAYCSDWTLSASTLDQTGHYLLAH